MQYYIAVLYIIFISIIFRNKSPFLILLFLFPLVLFSTFRGDLGPDTENYVWMFNHVNLSQPETLKIAEPLFVLLICLSKSISSNVEFFFFLNALLICSLYSFLICNFNKSKLYLLSIGPVFLISGLTNGMRIGVSYQILALAMLLNSNKRILISASLFHISSVVSYIVYFYIAPLSRKLTVKNIAYICFSIILTLIIISFLLTDTRVVDKFLFYSNYSSPSLLSGVSDLYIIFIVWLISVEKNQSIWNFIVKLLFVLIICLLLKFFSFYSYAFLRIIKLVMLGFVIYYSNSIATNQLGSKKILILLLLVPYTINYCLSVYSNPNLYM